MFDIHLLLSGFSAIASVEVFPFLVLGSLLGIIVGAIPA
jgi:TctA family transporter